jgi:hypothetical protein
MKSILLAVVALAMVPLAALAQHGPAVGEPRPAPASPPRPAHLGRFPAGPVSRFAGRDLTAWRGGYWWHGWRGGRIGWWWYADGAWYWYAAPAYPYPDYVPETYIAGAGAPPASGFSWWCANPPGYYPDVRGCPTPWRAVVREP